MATFLPLIPQTSRVTSGSNQKFPSSQNIRTIRFVPVQQGFSGRVIVEESEDGSSFNELLNASFTAHRTPLIIDVQTISANLRAKITEASSGGIGVYARSGIGNIQGVKSSVSSGIVPTAQISSSRRALGVGSDFQINSTTEINSDDISYATDVNFTLTNVLDGTGGARGKQDKIGNVTAQDVDLNILSGASGYNLSPNDFMKLADITVSAAEINRIAGITSNVLAITTPASRVDNFFDENPVVSMSKLNQLNQEFNEIDGSGISKADLQKLTQISVAASTINQLAGFVGSGGDLNVMNGLTANTADLNAMAGISSAGITAAEISHLRGLSENVQDRLTSLPDFTGLTATNSDLNILTGIYNGTGEFSERITGEHINRLSGVTSNIQEQLDAKRNSEDEIGIGEIEGVAISIEELNSLSGVSGQIQTQITNLSNRVSANRAEIDRKIGREGGDVTGIVEFTDGSYGVPSISFSSDSDTGIFKETSNTLGISAGGNQVASFGYDLVKLGGDGNDNVAVEVPGIFQGEKMLGTFLNFNAHANTDEILYTVPTRRRAFITSIIVMIKAGGKDNSDVFRMNVTGGGANFIDDDDPASGQGKFDKDSFNQLNDYIVINDFDNNKVLPENENLNAVVGAVSSRELTLDIIVFGYEIAA